jgi:hypothetical protein
MKWSKLLTAGAVAGMLAISGCSSNVPENNLGNRNGIKITDSAHRNYVKPRAKTWRSKGVNWSRSNMNRLNRRSNVTRSSDSRAPAGTVNNNLNRRARSSYESRAHAYNRSASAPIYRTRRMANADSLNRSTVRRSNAYVQKPAAAPSVKRTVTPKKMYRTAPRKTYQRPALKKAVPQVHGLMKNDYSAKYDNYDFALSRNNSHYARNRQRMNQQRVLHRNKYGAASNAFRKVKTTAAIDNNETVSVMSNQSQSIRNMEPTVNVKISDIDGAINTLTRMRGNTQVKPAVSRARQPIKISYKQKPRTRNPRKTRAAAFGFSKPVATIYLSKGNVVKVEPGTNAVSTSGINRQQRLTRRPAAGRTAVRNINRSTNQNYAPVNNNTMINHTPIVNNMGRAYDPMPMRRIMRSAGRYK